MPRSAAAARIAAGQRVLAAALGAGHQPQELGVVEALADRAVAPVPDPNSTTSVTRGLPSVIVPVLSSTTASSLCAVSSAAPSRMSTPFSAPLPVPTMIAVGVASPSAQGHAMTSTATKLSSA